MGDKDSSDRDRSDRRRVLAAGAAALPELVVPALGAPDAGDCRAPGSGPNAGYLPNVVLLTHEGRRVRFYDDLLLGRIVMVQFMSIAGEPATRATENLARAQAFLGGRLGRDVFLYSLTTEPERDTPEALARFAEQRGARPGWLFLTGEPADLALLRGRFFVDGGHPTGHPTADCSLGLIRYGNESLGLWGSVPCRAEPDWIARRIDWVSPRQAGAGPHRRRGPVPGYPFPGAVAGRPVTPRAKTPGA